MKEQWKQGLQWGAGLWLAWLAFVSIVGSLDSLKWGFVPEAWVSALGWTLAFALAWTRFSRFGAALGIAFHAFVVMKWAPPTIQRVDMHVGEVMSQSYLNLEPALSAFLPACLPLVPLLFMAPVKPRYVAALAMLGRWTDAARELAGTRWILVAAGVLAFHAVSPDGFRWWGIDSSNGRLFLLAGTFVPALAPVALLFGLAALRTPHDH